uniref:Orn/DAP/Arg decarboxylase 2 N-terminal domain-containing protein n=1 Tax=Piliocolobus tephrosceles TaxID=591936 RepID=A0A8C9HLZ2_9PRIM
MEVPLPVYTAPITQQIIIKNMYDYCYEFCKKNKVIIVEEDGDNLIYEVNNAVDSSTTTATTTTDEVYREKCIEPKLNVCKTNEKSITQNKQQTNMYDMEKELKEESIKYGEKNKIEVSILNKALNENIDTSVICINLYKILHQYIRFKKNLPNVTPHYSIKCNNDDIILKFLYGLNCNFDCASVGEIKKLLNLIPDISRSRIIFANTIKSENSLKYAKKENINFCTFDNLDELKKIKKYHPDCSLLLRINVDFKNYKSYMSSKFGANKYEWEHILQYGKKNNLKIDGVSFHVGSNTKNLFDYCQAIKVAKDVFNISAKLGFKFKVLNIGGGYPEELSTDESKRNEKNNYSKMNEEQLTKHIIDFLNDKSFIKKQYSFFNFEKIALAIKLSINYYFHDLLNELKVICEPGRYMVASSSTLAVKIIGKRCPTFNALTIKDMIKINDTNGHSTNGHSTNGHSTNGDDTNGDDT